MEIPDDDDLNRSAWEQCNHLIQSWIINSVSPQIAQTLVFHETAIEAWLDLKECFAKADRIRIATLRSTVNNLKQGSKSVLEYFTEMRTLWEELNSHRPMPHCTCPHPCRWAAMREARNFSIEDQIIQFLTGLNDKFAVVKTQVLMMDPLPSINIVYAFIQEQSNNNSVASLVDEQISLVNAPDSRNRSQGRGIGYSSGPKPPRQCSFCGRSNHTVDYCYAKHGHPNFQKQAPFVNASSSSENNEATSRSNTDVPSPSANISQEKYDQLVSLLQQVNLLPSSSTPSVTPHFSNAKFF